MVIGVEKFMNIRAQMAMVFHLDKCIGCHTCSVSCKNLWSDRKGAEYMWWYNVETKPGTGYPYKWEDQERYKGGWHLSNDELSLNVGNRFKIMTESIFYNKNLPQLDDYYEPWTYDYEKLINAPESNEQPVARPISTITFQPLDVEYGPNWDDDLGGSVEFASKDINLESLSKEEREQLNSLERLVYFYLPRICNHCANPSCVAACPSGAMYKRGEDGIVLVSQEKCRSWRMCISGCPYKKVYFNWSTGKSEKCILCYPLLESGEAPACFHTCVGRLRYLGVLFYDADAIQDALIVPDEELVSTQIDIIKDPYNPEVIQGAKNNGISDAMIEAAQNSPVYKFIKIWGIALPLHAEFRTLPMLYYVPPLLPAIGKIVNGIYEQNKSESETLDPIFSTLEQARVPIQYMASLFSAGNIDVIKKVYKKIITAREYTKYKTFNQKIPAHLYETLKDLGLTPANVDDMSRLTTLATYNERFVIPPLNREVGISALQDPLIYRQETGFGFKEKPTRGG